MCRGHEPSLEITDAGLTRNAGWHRGVWRPSVLRSRFRLRCHERSLCFHVDKSLASVLRSGDFLHVARTAAGGLALAVLRDHQLVVAVGAVTAVPLGADIQARLVPERWNEALARLMPAPGVRNWNPRKEHRHEWPVEIQIAEEIGLFFRTNCQVGPYQVFIEHGFCVRRDGVWSWLTGTSARMAAQGLPGTDECVALVRLGECSTTGASASALLLSADGLETCE
jgi:hypothetical protein